ncbi:MAG TPA: type II secretion system F family protein [Methylophilaceae bacterium]|nr:type II secretion system F family protein [Methylophilaceae bacterium]
MPYFSYKAVDQAGHPAQGRMDAVNDVDLELRLNRMGLDLISFNLAAQNRGLFSGQKVSLQDLVMFCFQMEQLARAGVPLMEGLTDLHDGTESPGFREVIGALISEVEGGKQFSQALASHPNVFSNVFVSLVRAGEQSGRLPEVFENLASTLKWQDELISQTKRLLAYPVFLLLVVVGAITFLMIYLVPQMVTFLRNMGQELPLETKILIVVSEFFVNYWWLIFSLPALVVLGLGIAIRYSAAARYRYDFVKLHLPVTGSFLQKIILARFARYFALMYQAGIPILDAIKTCQDIAGNRVVADALDRVYQQINAGDSMSESFHNAGLFPPLVVRMIRVGENTGVLDKSLLNISYFYDRDVKESVEKMLKMLEPALTVILGALLAMIMFAVLGPVYDSMTKFKF